MGALHRGGSPGGAVRRSGQPGAGDPASADRAAPPDPAHGDAGRPGDLSGDARGAGHDDAFKVQDYVSPSLILRVLYIITTLLCLQMVFWVLVLPATWKQGTVKGWEEVSRKAQTAPDPFGVSADNKIKFVPDENYNKYGPFPIVRILHNFPGLIWAGCIPINLHPGLRTSYPTLHRYAGRAFFLSSFSLMVGFGFILYHGLGMKHENVPPRLGQSLLMLRSEGWSDVPHAVVTMNLASVWFCYTAVTALAAAKRRDFATHKRWAVRHVASGIWISMMRALLPVLHFALRIGSLLLWGRAVDTSEMIFLKAIWNDAGSFSIVTCFLLGEFALWAMKAETGARIKGKNA
mmetsp:Transcript_46083/g.109888  ORF Transcript_46083/g.109888 Transcript_46083/m.109888 type:complete len:348 (-) Transcript_46083:88-1131(-)